VLIFVEIAVAITAFKFFTNPKGQKRNAKFRVVMFFFVPFREGKDEKIPKKCLIWVIPSFFQFSPVFPLLYSVLTLPLPT